MSISLNEKKSSKIQALRGLAIIAVVFIHTTPGGMAQVFCRPFINFAVGLFLFLSGLLSDAKTWRPAKRLIRVLVPYAVWTFVYTVIHSYRAPDWIIRDYLHYLCFADSAAIMYYVFVYCEFTLLIPLIDRLARSKFKYIGFIVSPIEIICMRLIPLVFGIHLNNNISILVGRSCLGWFTYFYMGYLIGNGYIKLKRSTATIIIIWVISILLQMLEGYWFYSMGSSNCGTQMKLTAVLSGSLFCILAYKYIESNSFRRMRPLMILGNHSFGIYFSHLAIKQLLLHIPRYNYYFQYPLSSIALLVVSLVFVLLGHTILGRYAKYVAF